MTRAGGRQADPQRPRHLVDQAGVGGHVGVRPVPAAVFGPTKAGTVVVRFETALPPARLSLPQTGQQLRWGRLDVHLVRSATTRVSSARGRWP